MKGANDMVNVIKRIAAKFPDRVAAAIYQEGQIEMTESKRRCPVWNPSVPIPPGHVPGSLRASGHVHEPVRSGRNISVELSYGGPSVDYAVHVHENPDAFHAIGQWKYLESVLNESRAFMARRIAARIDLNRVMV